MVGNRKKIFSVPRVITIIAAGLSLLRIYDMYWEVGFQGTVAFLVERYDGAIEYLFGWIGKLFNIQIPIFWGHFVVVWYFFCGVVYRVYKKVGAEDQLTFIIACVFGPITFFYVVINNLQRRNFYKSMDNDIADWLSETKYSSHEYIEHMEYLGKDVKRSQELPKNMVYELLLVLLASLVWYITNVLAL